MDRRSKGYLMVAAAIALVAVGVAVWALFFRDPSPAPAPDIAPPVEDNALPTGEDDGDKLPQAQGGGAVNITYSDQVAVCLETRTVSLRFANPARSNQSMVVRLVLGGAGGGGIRHLAPRQRPGVPAAAGRCDAAGR